MVTLYRNAPELGVLAAPLIEAYHDHLIGYPLRFAWRSKAKKRRDTVTLGTAEIVRGRFAQFVMTEAEMAMEGQDEGPAMFWIEIAEDKWEELSDSQRLALLDHELLHCDVAETEDGWKMALRDHDVEEFNEIVRRHGLWKPSLFEFGLTVAEAVSMEVPDG